MGRRGVQGSHTGPYHKHATQSPQGAARQGPVCERTVARVRLMSGDTPFPTSHEHSEASQPRTWRGTTVKKPSLIHCMGKAVSRSRVWRAARAYSQRSAYSTGRCRPPGRSSTMVRPSLKMVVQTRWPDGNVCVCVRCTCARCAGLRACGSMPMSHGKVTHPEPHTHLGNPRSLPH